MPYGTLQWLIRLDIFLTTMKPLQKSVTAHDVESCLFYVHLESSEDAKLLEMCDMPQSSFTGDLMEDARATGAEGVKRKPVSSAPVPGLGGSQQQPSSASIHHQPPLHQVDYLSPKLAIVPANLVAPDGPSRNTLRPLHGPRPMHPHLHTVDEALQSSNSSIYNMNPQFRFKRPDFAPSGLPPGLHQSDATIWHSYAENLPGREIEVGGGSPPKVMRFNKERKSWSPRGDPIHGEGRDISLTLIRRYDGIQSNVGRILQIYDQPEGPPMSHSPTKPLSNPSVNTTIEIYTPGYRQFAKPAFEDWPGTNPIRDSAHMRQSFADNDEASTRHGAEQNVIFRRQLRMRSARRRPQLQPLLDANDSSAAYLRPTSSPDVRRYSQQAMEPIETDEMSPSSSLESTDSSSKGHTFESPWRGKCEFRTGIAGRSLKCTHSPAASNYSSRSSSSVSELRFNLPSSSALGPPRSQSSTDSSTTSKRSSIFSHSRGKSTSDLPLSPAYGSKIELEDRLALSLGRERAGGGFGGKQAKLGKLIIEEEGLKMLDLVVAANVALVSHISICIAIFFRVSGEESCNCLSCTAGLLT